MTIIKTINNITAIMQFFVPGFLGVELFCGFTRIHVRNAVKILLSCVISYALISVLKLIPIVNKNLSTLPLSGLAILAAIGLAFLACNIVKSNRFQNFILRQSHGTIHTDYWQDAIDFENGMNVKIYPKDSKYYVIGDINLLSDYNDKERWISLSNFGKYDKSTNDPLKEELYELDDDSCYHIRLSDIEHIETFGVE